MVTRVCWRVFMRRRRFVVDFGDSRVCRLLHPLPKFFKMTPPPGPYSGKNTLALVGRVSAVAFGLVYGNMKLKYLKASAKSCKVADAAADH